MRFVLYFLGVIFIVIALGAFIARDILWGILLGAFGVFIIRKGRKGRQLKTAEIFNNNHALQEPETINSLPRSTKTDTKVAAVSSDSSLPSIFPKGINKTLAKQIITILDNYSSDPQAMNREFVALLLGSSWEWPKFDEWHKRFSELGYFPYMWASVQNPPPEYPESAIQTLKKFASLSLDARRLLVGNNAIARSERVTRAIEDMGRRVGMTEKEAREVIMELQQNGFAEYPLDIKERLLVLRVADLKELCKEFDLPVSGRKEQLAIRLAENVTASELEAVLPSEARRDSASIGSILPLRARNVIAWEIAKIELLAHTTLFRMYRLRDIKRFQEHNVKKVKVLGVKDDPCPICSPKDGKELLIGNLNELPPFHPGCRCSIVPDIEYQFDIGQKETFFVNGKYERQANQFAAELLLAEDKPYYGESIEDYAKRKEVPVELVRVWNPVEKRAKSIREV